MTAMHPLAPIAGEQVFDIPPSVRAACKAALGADRGGDAHPFAIAIAEHLAAGEPIGESTAKRLHEVMSEADAGHIASFAKARTLMGGNTVLTWTAGLVGGQKAGATTDNFVRTVDVLKVDDALGVVFGWAMVCTEDGEDYYDSQDDHIPEAAMLKAATDFMGSSRVLGDMHQKAEGGTVLFAFPLTADVAKSFGIECKTTGLMIGVKPANEATLEKFRSGEYTGFSIGGRRIKDEDA